MQNLNGTNLNAGIVPSHAIVTEYDPSFFANLATSFISAYISASLPCSANSANGFLNYLFYSQPNDLIVSLPSQRGGLDSKFITHYFNQTHIGAEANSFVIDQVKTLLSINPANSNIFSQTGFSPINLSGNSHYKTNNSDASMHKSQEGSINILSPNSGLALNPGDTIHVNFNSNNGITRTILQAYPTNSSKIFIKDTILSSGIINYLTPVDAFGKIGIILIGYDAAGTFVDYDTLSINLNVTSTLDSITCSEDTLYVQKDRTTTVNLSGYFSNGYSNDISNANGILYQIADTNIAKPFYLNSIKGKQIGSTMMLVAYLGQTKNIPVVVTPLDTTIMEINLLPNISVEGPITFCEGDNVNLTASPGISYLWSTGETTKSITVNSTGNYKVTVTNFNDYTATSAAINVTVNPLPEKPNTIAGSIAICKDSTQTYSINPVANATSYTWTLPSGWTGSSTTNSIISTAGIAGGNITVKAINGCGSSTEQILAVTTNRVPSQPDTITGNSIVLNGQSFNYTINPVPGATGYNWQLSGGGTITNGQNTTAATINWTAIGNYILSVNAVNACGNSIVQSKNLVVSAATAIINPDNAFLIAVVPNPSAGEFYLKAKGLINKSVKIEVMNSLGQTIYQLQERVSVNDFNKMLDLRKMADGIYFVKISVDKKVYLRTIIKQY